MKKIIYQIFDILIFRDFEKRHFFAIFADSAFFIAQKIAKNQNIKNLVDDFLQTTPETAQSKFQLIWTTVVKVISRFVNFEITAIKGKNDAKTR